MRILELGLRHFLALSLILGSLPSFGAWSVDFPRDFETLTSTQLPIDEREVRYFRAARFDNENRLKGLAEWTSKGQRDQAFETLIAKFEEEHPGLLGLSLKPFFNETTFMFALIRNNRLDFASDEYENWEKSWLEVDLRYLPPELVEAYSKLLIDIFATAFRAAGPFTAADLERAQLFIDQHRSLWENHWNKVFRKTLAERGLHAKLARIKRRRDIPAHMLVGGIVLYSIYSGASFVAHALPALLAVPLIITAAIVGYKKAGAVISKTVNYALTSPALYPGQDKYTFLFRSGTPTCDELLRLGLE